MDQDPFMLKPLRGKNVREWSYKEETVLEF